MVKKSSKIVVVLAVLIAVMFLLPTVLPLTNANSTNLAGNTKAKPWDAVMPKQTEIPLISSLPKDKVSPKIYDLINKGAKSVQAIIVYDWNYRDYVLANLPEGSRLLNFASEIIQYLPLLGVELPADKQAIDKLASLPYVKLIAYNAPLDAKKMLQFIPPQEELKYIRDEPKTQAVIPARYYALPTDIAQEVNATPLYQMGITGKNVLIGILDTAINPRHPDFFFPNGTSKIVFTFSPYSGEDAYSTYYDIYNYYGHGTHVTSIAAGSGQGQGQGWYLDRNDFYYKRASIPKGAAAGLAPDAKIAFFKIFPDPNLSTEYPGTVYHVAAAIVQAVKVGVDVINASWGFVGFDVDTQAVLYYAVAWAIQCGVVWVNSAGNYGPGFTTLGFPAAQESVITVGITYPINYPVAGYGGAVVYWSSRGPTYPANSFFQHGTDIIPTTGFLSAGRAKPDVVAPGFGIMAANAGFEIATFNETISAFDPNAGNVLNTGAKYKTLSGTSMSAPVVTGIVALLIQAFPGATPAAIKAALIKSATPVATVNGVNDPNIGGAGKVNAGGAYQVLLQSNKKSNFVIPPPYWADEKKISPDNYKRIFAGYKILVNDITATSDRLNWWDDGTAMPQYMYENFINDLRNRGATIDYLSSKFNPTLKMITVTETIESPHPYQPLTDEFYHIYYPGARLIQLHFAQIGLGINPITGQGGYIVVYNWDWSEIVLLIVPPPGDITNVLYPPIDGPGVHIRLVASNSTGYGFKVDYYNVWLPKPNPVNYNVRREVTVKYYWLDSPQDPWKQNLASVNPPINVPIYQDTSSDPWYRKEYNIYTLTFDNLVAWFNVTGSISQCYWPYIPKGNFSAYDIWLPIASYGINYTSAFDPNAPPSLASIIAGDKAGTGIADILYVNATVYDTQTKTYSTRYLYIQTYDPYNRNGQPASGFSDLTSFAKNTVPGLLFNKPPKYGASGVQYLTGVDSWKWIRLVADLSNPSRYKIFVNATNPIKFWFISNGDNKGGDGMNAPYIALGSKYLYTSEPASTADISIFNTVIVAGTTNKPNALFFAQYDLVLILSPWYVDNDWINATELKKYVDNYIGRVLFIGGYIPRNTYYMATEVDEPSYMIPIGSEVGTGVKMNNYTLPFGIDWIRDSRGGVARIVVNNPIFAPWVDEDGNLNAPRLYLGHQIMSMRVSAPAKVWAYDPVYPAVAFYNSTSCNGALFISDDSVLSDVTYGSNAFPYHRWFGLRAVAYLLDPIGGLINEVNQWFYPIGGPANGYQGLFVMIKYNKIVSNGTVWQINVTFTNTLPYNVALNVTLQVPSNSTTAGLKVISGLPLTTKVVVPAASRDSEGNLIPSQVNVALGGQAYTKPLQFVNQDMIYYPVYTSWWSTFKINLFIYGNLTQTGTIDYNNPLYTHLNRAVSILNKPPRAGDLPLVTASTPFKLDSYTASLIAKYPLDFKYVNFTIINPDVSTSVLHAKITGNVSAVAQFFTLINETLAEGVWRVKLVLLGSSMDLTPENVSAIAGQYLESYPVPILGVPIAVHDGHYPGLPHTGHYFAPVFVFIDPNLASGLYTGNLEVYDDNGNLVATSRIEITVDQSPNGYFVWDDGLYVNNRPAVDDPANYHGLGVAVFQYHDWPMLPWVNAFELWKTLSSPPLNFAIKPSGVISEVLDMIATNQTPNQPIWKIEAFYRDLVDKAFGKAQGFMLIENNHFQPFTGYYFAKEIDYGPEQRWVNYTARDIMIKILAQNAGTLIIFSQFGSANNVNPISGQTNQYNMNWVLNYVGSRVYFPTGENKSAARDVMPFTEGLPSMMMPLTAGWDKITLGGIPYNTLDFYYQFGPSYELITDYQVNQTNRKLFLDVNSRNLDPNNYATYSKFVLATPIQTPEPYPPLTTYVYKITVPNADYVLPVFDYIVISAGTVVQVLDSNYNIVGSFVANSDTEVYGKIISAPVRGDTVYIKFASGTAVKPGFDKGIGVSYVLYASTAYLNDLANFYVKNEYREGYTYQAGRFTMASWQAIAGKWGPALVLDTHLTGVQASYGNIPLPNAKVIAFGEYSWFSNAYFEHAITHMVTPFQLESRWSIILRIFLRSIFQYAAGYYSLVSSGMQALTTFVDYLNLLATNARNAGMNVSSSFDNLIAQTQSYLSQANAFILDGNYIDAAKPLLQANSTANQAASVLVAQLSNQAFAARDSAWSLIMNATNFINTTATYNVDVKSARDLLNSAYASFASANATLAAFKSSDPATWTTLIDSFKGFKSAMGIAMNAWSKAGDSAYILASMLRDQITQLSNEIQALLNQFAQAGIGTSDVTKTKLTTYNNKVTTANSELASYNAADVTTYPSALKAIADYRDALTLGQDVEKSIYADARSTVASRLSDLKAKIASVKAQPHDEAKLSDIEARVPDLENRLNSAVTASDYIRLLNDINNYIAKADAAILTPTPSPTPFPFLQLAIIVVLIIILIFALIYAATRRRARTVVAL